MRAFFVFCAVVSVACGDEIYEHAPPRVCDGADEVCSCQALAKQWCVGYNPDGELNVGECAELGGVEVAASCPEDDRVGICLIAGDCPSPAFSFYDGYDGGFRDFADVDALEAACNAGDLVDASCAEWQDG